MAARREPYHLAGFVSIPFLLLILVDGFWKPALLRGPFIAYWSFDFAKWILLPILLLAILHRRSDVVGADYGLAAPLGMADLVYIFPLPFFSLFFADLVAVQVSARLLGYPQPYFDLEKALAALGPLWIVGTIYTAATAAFWESVFFIGLPWLWFSRTRAVSQRERLAFTLLTAGLFALAHWENGAPNSIGAFIFQCIAVWWFLRLRTLWPVVAAHFAVDVIYFWPRVT
ncbi:MAG TPA: CPBP family intramembrane glutamic endopeptidase [Burkholderiales bacterium]|nr:CPBP family intramembrane glutamic endopeptidase [Burkholderiales bacterium]